MTTRNLVPRATNEGKIGISTKKWAEVNATNATFTTLKVTNLKLDSEQDLSLLTASNGIEDISANASGQLVIALDDTFLSNIGLNADASKPDFAAHGTVLAADSFVTAINKLDQAVSNVADPANLDIDNFSAATIVLEGEGISNNDNDTTLPTSAAVKNYVDSQLTLQDLDFQGDAGGALAVDLDSQVLTIAGGTGLSTSGADQTLTINIDDTAVTPGAYGSATAIPTFTVDQQGRLTAAGTEAISTSLIIQSDDNVDNTVALATDKLKILGGTAITTSNSGDDLTVKLDDTAVTPNSYGSATEIPTFTVDQQGRLTAAGTVGITTTLTVDSDDAGSQNVSLAEDDLQILGGAGLTSSIAKANNEVTLTLNLDDTAVAAAQYGDADSVGQFTVDAKGRLTQAASVDISIASSQVNDATAANTSSKIVLRDGNGDFSAGTITASLTGDVTGNLTGNADTATAWATGRTIELTGDVVGTSAAFDGSGNLSFATAIATNSVALGTDTTGDYVESLVAGDGITLSNNSGESATPTIAVDGVLAQLDDLAPLADGDDDGKFIVATAANTFAYESGDTAKTSLGLGTGDSPEFSGLTLDNQGSLILKELNNNGDHNISIKSPASLAASYELVLPVNDGSANEVLVTDGDGNLTWNTVEAAAGNAVNAFSIIAVDGQDNLEADTSQDTLNITEGSGISLTTNNANGTDTLTIAVSNIDNNDIAAAAGIVDTKLATISTANKVSISALDLDGGADIGADLVDADLIVVDDGAGGTNRKSAMSRVATFINDHASITTLSKLSSVGEAGQTLTTQGSLSVDQNLTITGNLIVNGSQFQVDGTTVQLDDNLIELGLVDKAAPNGETTKDLGLVLHRHDGANASKLAFYWDESVDKFKLESGITETNGIIDAGGTTSTLVANVEGNASTASALAASVDIGGVAFNGSASINLPGVNEAGNQDTSGNAATATEATNITATANNDTDETVYLTFVDGATGTQGIETDTGLTYNPSSGLLTSTSFAGALSGNATTATALAEAKTIGMTGDVVWTSAAFNGSQNVTGTATIQDDAITGAKIDIISDSAITNAKLANSSVSLGGVTVSLGGTDATPAFDLQDATNLPTTSLTGTITNNQLEGNIANGKLVNSSVSLGGVTVSLGGTDATPAFDLQDATGLPTTSLTGTITNDQLEGNIANGKLANSSVSLGGVSISLGGTDATPAFDLQDATGLPTTSLTGTITNDQLEGSIVNGKLQNSSVSLGGVSISLGGTDATPAFNLEDATGLPTTSLTGTITNDQLAGNIDQGKLDNISAANKIKISALDIDQAGVSVNSVALADSIIIDQASNGTNRSATLTRVRDLLQTEGIVTSLPSLATVGTITSGTWQSGDGPIADAYVANDLTISGGSVDSSPVGANSHSTGKFTTLQATTSLQLATGATITGINDTDDMSDASATTVATSESIKAYVDTQITAQDLDFSTSSGNGSVDLDSQTLALTVEANKIIITHEDQSVKFDVGSDIVQLAETQTLTNKTLTSPVVSGLSLSDSSIIFEGATSNDFETTLSVEDPTADRTLTLPDASDTLVGRATTDTLTNKTIDADNNTVSNLEVDNLKAGVLDTSLTTTADTDTTLPSAKAVKTYVDGKIGRFGGIFKTDSVDANGNYDVIFASDPIVRSHFGPFTFNLKQLITENGSDIEFFGATAFGASDRHFEVMPTTDANDDTYGAGETIKGDCLFTGADANTP